MTALTREQASSREKTLLLAVLLSMWAPLATGIAVLSSHSTTQLADFVRRTVELVALLVAWWVFRYLERRGNPSLTEKARLERMASLSVAVAMLCSALVMVVVALSRLSSFEPGGNVYPGLTIAILGLLTNGWFWRRYALMTHEHYNPIIASQHQLYRAKTVVDCFVTIVLLVVVFAATHPLTRYIDILGSVIVAGYMAWSGARAARSIS